jgi:hypothetical protein
MTAAIVAVGVFLAAGVFVLEAFGTAPTALPGASTSVTSHQAFELTYTAPAGWEARSDYQSLTLGPVLEAANYNVWAGQAGLTDDFYSKVVTDIPPDGIALRVQELVGICGCEGFRDAGFPLAIAASDVQAWGTEAYSSQGVRVGDSFLLFDVEFGKQPGDQQIAEANAALANVGLGSEVRPSPSTTTSGAPSFDVDPGWNTGSMTSSAESNPSVAWAANVPFEVGDLLPSARQSTLMFSPQDTMKNLPPNGVVVVASMWVPKEPVSTPTSTLPLQLESARVESNWEGQVAQNVPQYTILSTIGDARLDVRIYFGAQQPDSATLASAQGELNRLSFAGVAANASPA